jgi:2-polyprenyl-3-methyl-5-hydroxy-6-metoxy-1,4-benzoquinol methylase
LNSSHKISQRLFDQQYHAHGINAQRLYPNEALVQFIGSRFFHLSAEERRRVSILEVGCGSGANLWMMAKEGFEVHGMDSSEKGLQLAQEHLDRKWGVSVELKKGSFLELPYPDQSFDTIVDVVSLQHLGLADSGVALREIRRVLCPHGTFFSYRLSDHSIMFQKALPCERSDSATLINIMDPELPLANNGPISFWSPSLVHRMYSDAGLSVEKVSRISRTYFNGDLVEYLAIEAVPISTLPLT